MAVEQIRDPLTYNVSKHFLDGHKKLKYEMKTKS